ncbi:NAD(P)/FAD-dependent oxidoreductase [Piscinibacter sakaiensis]|uniref:NAD(P)/FAD-dependent oxidoreductase n=1 Tax=Piscinibacter sakaiensis TaxID=1547922 RepID=UPI003AADB3F8
MAEHDVVIIGAGAAGLFCAGIAGQLGLKVLLIDHSPKIAEKIRISGGGRCNFTNRETGPGNFLSANPHFCRSALARYSAQDFIALLQRHRIAFHEKHKGQLFCDNSADDVIGLLLRECDAGGVVRWQPCEVAAVRHGAGGFELDTDRGPVRARRLVVASGGLSIPKIGASDFGYRLARQFGHRIIETRPALVPLTFAGDAWQGFVPLAGVALPARVATASGKARGEFLEDLLFTHRGLSGPAILQISSFWRGGTPIELDLAPGTDLGRELLAAKAATPRRQLDNALAQWLPRRLAEAWSAAVLPGDDASSAAARASRPLADWRDRELHQVAATLQRWTLIPNGTEGYRKAEVTAGGVDTRELSSSTMASQRLPGLYFIGEVVDVTGWLGGYNFQWAWASAAACARAMAAEAREAA